MAERGLLSPVTATHTALSAEHRPFPHTYLHYRLAYLGGAKTEAKSEQTYLSQAQANHLQEKPQGQEAQQSSGHGGERAAGGCGGGSRKVRPAAAPLGRPRTPWGGSRGLEEG